MANKEKLFLRKITDCSLEVQLQVREIRLQKSVRTSMFTEHEIGVNEHLKWIKRLESDTNQIVFVIFSSSMKPIGVVSVNEIDNLHKKANWAYYLDENQRGFLGAVIEYNFIKFLFNELKLEKLNCEVIETNDSVITQHKKFNFKEEGFKRSNIIKDGNRIGVNFLGLTKKEWLEVQSEYKSLFSKFEVLIDTQDKKVDDTLSRIQQARAKNNVNWMALLRICVEKDPEISKKIIKEILCLDRQISDLTAKLVDE